MRLGETTSRVRHGFAIAYVLYVPHAWEMGACMSRGTLVTDRSLSSDTYNVSIKTNKFIFFFK